MQNIDEILIRYFEAYFDLSKLTKGDWSKVDILINNNEKAKELDEIMTGYMDEFREAISFGKIFTYSPELDKFYKALESNISEPDSGVSVSFALETARDVIADLLSEDGEDDDRVKAIDNLAQLPNYSPDDWVRRKYMIRGVFLSPQPIKIPQSLIRRFEEACFSFIYGNFLASIALARATAEMALKERFPKLKNQKLDQIVNQDWHKIKGLKGHDEMQKMTEFIRAAGNQIMHKKQQNKVIRIYNEFATISVLQNLRSLIEFLYQ